MLNTLNRTEMEHDIRRPVYLMEGIFLIFSGRTSYKEVGEETERAGANTGEGRGCESREAREKRQIGCQTPS